MSEVSLRTNLDTIQDHQAPAAPRPVLRYLETHLTDHCNFSCKGCGHFSPIAEPWFADPETFTADIVRLAVLFSNIYTIRLLGGEPLLHRSINRFSEVARKHFPHARVCIVTNGVLLPKMADEFWQTCAENRIRIQVSVYPSLQNVEKLPALSEKHGVVLQLSNVTRFLAFMNPKGDSDPAEAMKVCRRHFYCPLLRDGKIYLCPFSAQARHYNARFGANIPDAGSIDIHSSERSGDDILRFLKQPVETCRFCACSYRNFDWNVTTKHAEEWWANAN